MAVSGIIGNSLTLSERGPRTAKFMGTPESRRFSEPGDLTNSDLSSFPEYKAESICLSILTYQDLSGIEGLEWLPIHARPYPTLSLGLVFSTGQISLASMAYAVPDWCHLQLLCSQPFFVIFIYSRAALFLSFYGLILNLQSFGINIYMIQLLFTITDFLFLLPELFGHQIAGPQAYPNCLLTAVRGLHPGLCNDTHRQSGQSMTSILANTGSMLSPLVGLTTGFYTSLLLFIHGAVPLAASTIPVFVPETLGQPLPNTIEDLERRWKKKLGPEQQEQQVVLLQAS